MGVWFSSLWKPKKRLEDLDDDCLMQVLDQLSPANLMKMARVNKRLKRLVEVKLRVKIKKVVVESKWKETFFNESALTCRHRCFDSIEIVYLDSMFAQKKINNKEEEKIRKWFYRILAIFQRLIVTSDTTIEIKEDFYSARAKDRFITTMARFKNIKSIDFGVQELTNEVLQEVAKLCPEIECLTVKRSVVDVSVWNDFFTQFGHQIVHFQLLIDVGIFNQMPRHSLSSERILEMIVLMCPNVKQVEFYMITLTKNITALLKKLPQNCSVGVIAFSVNQPCDEAIDFLFCHTLNWSCFKNSFNYRLTELSFNSTINLDEPDLLVEFADLKKLSWHSVRHDSKPDIDFLSACRFPKLESFDFKANSDLTEHDYEVVFENMPELKQLNIEYFAIQIHPDYPPDRGVLPEYSVLQLKKLERLQVTVNNRALNWQPKDNVRRLNWFVKEIPSLKKLDVTLVGKPYLVFGSKLQMIADKLEQLKKRQKRVEIVVNFL